MNNWKEKINEKRLGEILYYYNKLLKKDILTIDKVGNNFNIIITDIRKLDSNKINKENYTKLIALLNNEEETFLTNKKNNQKEIKKVKKLYLSDFKKNDFDLFITIYNKLINQDIIISGNNIKDDFFLFCKNLNDNFEITEIMESIKKVHGFKIKVLKTDEEMIRNAILMIKIILILINYQNYLENKGGANYSYQINNFLVKGYKKFLSINKDDIRYLGKELPRFLNIFIKEKSNKKKYGFFDIVDSIIIDSILENKKINDTSRFIKEERTSQLDDLINSF